MAALIFIIKTLLGLLVTVFLLRVLLPLCRADSRNPFSQAVIKMTNPLVLPLRRLLPPLGRVDSASVVALLLMQLLATALIWLLSGLGFGSPWLLLLSALRELLIVILQFYFFIILISAVLSWVGPGNYNPGTSLINSLAAPVLKPFQRLIPPIAGIDLSALFALIAIQALLILINS